MKKITMLLMSTVAITALSGCSASRYCVGAQPYQQAGSLPVLKDANGLDIPRSTAAMEIPKGKRSSEGYASSYVDQKGKSRTSCLDTPPRLEAVASAEG